MCKTYESARIGQENKPKIQVNIFSAIARALLHAVLMTTQVFFEIQISVCGAAHCASACPQTLSPRF